MYVCSCLEYAGVIEHICYGARVKVRGHPQMLDPIFHLH